jgi:hypothetical protein
MSTSCAHLVCFREKRFQKDWVCFDIPKVSKTQKYAKNRDYVLHSYNKNKGDPMKKIPENNVKHV